MIILSPSILAADFTKLGEQVQAVEKAGAQALHLDVMDGCFVPSISFGMPVIRSLRKQSKLLFDVHLMIEDPDRYLEEFASCGADILTVHAETAKHLHRTLTRIRELGMKAGVAYNPASPLCGLEYILSEVDMVLIMTVNPGFGGQTFLPFTLEKVKEVRQMAERLNPSLWIEVDGGINKDTAGHAINAGANVLVAGTAVFKGNIEENVKKFRGMFSDGCKDA